MTRILKLKNGSKEIKFGGTLTNKELEVEIGDDMNDYFAYTYLTEQDLIDIRKHIDKVLQQV